MATMFTNKETKIARNIKEFDLCIFTHKKAPLPKGSEALSNLLIVVTVIQ